MHTHIKRRGTGGNQLTPETGECLLRWVRPRGSDRSGCCLYRDSIENRMIRKHLGSGDKHMVFEAKVLGLSLEAELIKTNRYVQ